MTAANSVRRAQRWLDEYALLHACCAIGDKTSSTASTGGAQSAQLLPSKSKMAGVPKEDAQSCSCPARLSLGLTPMAFRCGFVTTKPPRNRWATNWVSDEHPVGLRRLNVRVSDNSGPMPTVSLSEVLSPTPVQHVSDLPPTLAHIILRPMATPLGWCRSPGCTVRNSLPTTL